MTDPALLTDLQLEDRKAALTRRFLTATGEARAALDAEIRAIEQEQRRRALLAGEAAAGEAGEPTGPRGVRSSAESERPS